MVRQLDLAQPAGVQALARAQRSGSRRLCATVSKRLYPAERTTPSSRSQTWVKDVRSLLVGAVPSWTRSWKNPIKQEEEEEMAVTSNGDGNHDAPQR